jgi:quinol monooxygenase YgiN
MTFVVVAKWVARPGQDAPVRSAIHQLIEPTLQEPGCIEYRAHQNLDDPCVFMLYEVYARRDAYEEHLRSSHFLEYAVGQGIPLLERREREFYSELR